MKRDTITKKLERIIAAVERGDTPTRVREIWLFGSSRRGAQECGDLDLGVVVDEPDQTWFDATGFAPWDSDSWPAFLTDTRCALRNRGERIHIHIEVRSEGMQTFFASVPIEDPLLIWSEPDPSWRGKVDAIAIDPEAGRFKRDYPIDLRRTRTSRSTMEEVLWLVKEQRLVLSEQSLDDITPKIAPRIAEHLAYLENIRFRGKRTREISPYGYDWLRREKQRLHPCTSPGDTQLFSASGTHFVHLGKIQFRYVYWWLFNHEKATKLCLIPHLRKRSVNKMFIIERGPQWTGDVREIRTHRQK